MEELRKFESSTFDTLLRRKLIEDQNTIMELTGRVQELQNEVNRMNVSKDFQDAESVRSGISHVTSRPVSFLAWGTASYVYSGEKWKAKTKLSSEMPVWTVSQRFSHLQWRRLKKYGADQQRLQISDLHFDKFPTPATFACWKIRFKTEVCTCSKFLTEPMQWIKEVELVDSVDDLRSSYLFVVFQCRILKYLMRGLFQHWTKSSIISSSKRRISLEEQKGPEAGPFHLRNTDCLLDLRVLPGHWDPWFCRNYTDLFTIVLRNDDIQEFDSKWDGIWLSTTKIPHDDILEGLYKLRIRESEKLKTVFWIMTWRLIRS